MSKKLGDLGLVPWAGDERQVRPTRHSTNSRPKLLRLTSLTHFVGVPYELSGENKIND